jgi:hypothetical protein
MNSGNTGLTHPDPTIRAGIEDIRKRFRETVGSSQGTPEEFRETVGSSQGTLEEF